MNANTAQTRIDAPAKIICKVFIGDGNKALSSTISPRIIPILKKTLRTRHIPARSSLERKKSGMKNAVINRLIPIPTTNNIKISVFLSNG